MAHEPTPQHFSPQWEGGERPAVPDAAGERETLVGMLDWHRATFALKCSGLTAAQLSERAVPPSALSLHGLARHLAGAERWWFRMQFAGEDVPFLHYSDDDPDQDFEGLDGDPAEDLEVWRAECGHSRRIVSETASLDATGIRRQTGEPVSLRKILVHSIAEYARHNGHADLLRERLDGAVGA